MMRRVRDSHLPDPFRAWIDRADPLPPGVTVLPRTVSVSGDVLALVVVGIGCVGIGVPIVTVVPQAEPRVGGWAVVGLISVVLVGVLTWLAKRLWRTIGASRDQKAGVLRQGVLVGPDGVLVRLKPNWCYPIPMERFVRAEKWTGGGQDGIDYVRIKTLEGPIDLPDEQLTFGAAEVNQAVAAARAEVIQGGYSPNPPLHLTRQELSHTHQPHGPGLFTNLSLTNSAHVPACTRWRIGHDRASDWRCDE